MNPLKENERLDLCSLCGREAYNVTEHHLVPRTTHKTKRFKKLHTVAVMNSTTPLCQPCHRAVHQFYSEKELADRFYTIELLLEDEKVLNHIEWVRKQRPDLTMKKCHKGKTT